MTSFPLTIVTPDGLIFDGEAQSVTVRTVTGDMGIMAGHINCVVPLGMGRAAIVQEDKKRFAACIGGMLTVLNGKVKIVATTFEWAENIDVTRAEAAEQRARTAMNEKSVSDIELRLAETRLKRALVRKSVAELK